MAISTLQRAAFQTSEQFTAQVNGAVVREAEYKFGQLPADPPEGQEWETDAQRQKLAQVVKQPSTYGFVPAMVALVTWGVTYDVWAANPDGAEGDILAAVQTLWPLLVGE